jgi:hypothetical protein
MMLAWAQILWFIDHGGACKHDNVLLPFGYAFAELGLGRSARFDLMGFIYDYRFEKINIIVENNVFQSPTLRFVDLPAISRKMNKRVDTPSINSLFFY